MDNYVTEARGPLLEVVSQLRASQVLLSHSVRFTLLDRDSVVGATSMYEVRLLASLKSDDKCDLDLIL